MTGTFLLGSLASILALASPALAPAKVAICHIPPGNPENAHIISVSPHALNAHLGHGDVVVPEDLTCTAGVGLCAVDGLLICTSEGLICDASPNPPPEATETSCTDGQDNDCDGQIDQADADCATCPASIGLQAILTRQTELKNENACKVDIQIATLTNAPVHLVAQSVDVPMDVGVDSVQTSSCNVVGTNVVCRHDMTFDFTTSGSFDGDYHLHLDVQCDPGMPACPACSGTESIPFSLDGTSCDTTVIDVQPGEVHGTVWADVNGDGVRDPGDNPLDNSSGVMVEIYADSAPLDGLPDTTTPLATSPTDENGMYGFAGLDGTYVMRPVGGAGTCPSSGLDSQIDPNTGYTHTISVLAADPKQVLSGVNLGLTTVCSP
jgi:hypothetical protein